MSKFSNLLLLVLSTTLFFVSCGKTERAGPDGAGPKDTSDFSLAMTKNVAIEQGSAATLAVLITKKGAPGTVTIDISGSPLLSKKAAADKISYGFNHVIYGVTYQLKIGREVPAGDYELTITGNANTISHRLDLKLTVTAGNETGSYPWSEYDRDTGYGKLLFSSGFEESVSISPVQQVNGTLYEQHLSGTDAGSNYSWPIGGDEFVVDLQRAPYFFMLIDVDKTLPQPDAYMLNGLREAKGYLGKPTRVLNMTVQNGPGISQNWLYLNPAAEVKALYYRFRMRLPDDLLQTLEDPGWRSIAFFKSVSTDYRIEPAMYRRGNALFWSVKGDHQPGGKGTPLQTFWGPIDNHDVPVPVGEWFTVEIYWNRGAGADGRYFWSVDGYAVADYHGPIKRKNPIDRVGLFGIYAKGSPQSQWVDDLEIWDAPPCPGLPCVVKPLR